MSLALAARPKPLNSNSFSSLCEARRMKAVKKHIFNDRQLALQAIEAVRWPNGIACDRCGSHTVDRHGKTQHRCKKCSRAFDYSTGTVLEQLSLSPPDLLYAVYTFSTHRYRASATAQLSSKLPTDVIEDLWRLIQRQCRTYQGYKRTFGQLVHAEMPPTPRRLAGVRKQRLLAAGKHQSQLTIYPRDRLTAPKTVAKPSALGRCECLLVLLMRRSSP